jgi:glucose/arabinose dehydrogenase
MIRSGKIAAIMIATLALLPARATIAYIGVEEGAAVDEELGMVLPDGFSATIFADNLGFARHVTVRGDGVVYVALRQRSAAGGIVALRDNDGDGISDRIEYFGALQGTGIAMHNGYLYFATNTAVVRYAFEGGEMVPGGNPEVIIDGFPVQRQHAAKPFTFDEEGHIYVTVGAPSNACQQQSRSPGSPGINPCPQLNVGAGIWRFDADRPGQSFEGDGRRYSTGIRNAMAIDWNHDADALYFVTHGRDQLSQLWSGYYTDQQNAELPSEEFHRASEGSNHGWPYTYWDHRIGARMQGPEYGGDGIKVDTSGDYVEPIATLPGHWAPNDLMFLGDNGLPEEMHGGALVVFHGSWNRAPLPQGGFKILYFPFSGGSLSGQWSVFADGFAGGTNIGNPRNARFRPMGLAQAGDGTLYITDSQKGRVWQVRYDPN